MKSNKARGNPVTILLVWPVVLFTLIVLISGCDSSLNPKQGNSAEFKGIRKSVSISVTGTPLNWLLIIAIEQGFFSGEGLDVTPKYYPSGKRSLLGMFAGEVDIASVADVPIVFQSFKRQDFSIFATIGSSDNDNKIVARKDRGIQKPEDLKGKRIATHESAAAHFFQYLFLLKNGLLEKEVEVSFMKAEKLPGALVRGEVDAITTREPFFSEVRELLGDTAVVFADRGLYSKAFHQVAFKNFIRENPEIIRRVLRAMLQAEEFVRNDSGQAIKILSSKLEISEDKIAAVLPELNLKVQLSQLCLLRFDDEARWVLKKKWADGPEIPNYLNFVYLDALKAVKPERVTIIH